MLSPNAPKTYNNIATSSYIVDMPYKRTKLYNLPKNYLDLLVESYHLKRYLDLYY